MFFKIALRNIWRNKTRTLITSASIFFAVLFSSFMISFQQGSWDRMLDNIINYYYGYIQVQKKGYWDDKSIDNSFIYDHEIISKIDEVPEIKADVPRLESFALASYGNQTSGMMIVGTDPEKEDILTGLKEKITEGKYLSNNDQAVIIAEGVKKVLKVGLGDSITLISQGFHGVNAAGMYPVVGIVKFTSPDLNKSMIYMPLREAEYFFDAEDMVTSLALKIDDKNNLKEIKEKLISKIDTSSYSVLDWEQMLPDLVAAKKADTAGNYLFIVVLYALIAFGIFGTILMMSKEREYEFGVLISIGMKRKLLAFVVWLEILILGLVGSLAGIIASIPLVYYFHVNPIDFSDYNNEMGGAFEKWGFDPIIPTKFDMSIFYDQALVVILLTSILSFYAIYKILTVKPVEAMRG